MLSNEIAAKIPAILYYIKPHLTPGIIISVKLFELHGNCYSWFL